MFTPFAIPQPDLIHLYKQKKKKEKNPLKENNKSLCMQIVASIKEG